MDGELLELWQTLSAEHNSNFVELSRFLGFAKGYYDYTAEDVTFWLLEKIDAGKVQEKFFAGRQYIKFNF